MTAMHPRRICGLVLITTAWLGLFGTTAGRAQGPPLPVPGGKGIPFTPGNPLPAPGVNGPGGQTPMIAPVQPTPPTVATPRITVPTLQTLGQIGGAPQAAPISSGEGPQPGVVHLTLEDAKQRTLANNKLLQIGNLNAQAKEFAIRAARSDYFPKLTGSVMYFHFNDNLGTVLSGGGRTVTGLRGRPLFTLPTTTVEASVLNQNSTLTNLNVLQPLTDLLKVRQGVKIARADQEI